MKAVQFNYSFLRYVLCKTVGKFLPSLHWNSQLSCLHYGDIPEPALPNNEWVKIKVKYGGICGSDINLIFLRDSPALSPFTSFPFTLGHELVGIITEVGSEVKHVIPGDRVVIDPVLSCETRGISRPCSACQHGDFSLCEHMTDGHVSPGLLVGTCHDTGGSWSPYLVAHQSQVFKLPPEINDINGVMVEPFSCALHSVLRNPPKNHDTVFIIGAGVIGLCIIAAIRALGISCRIIVLAKHDYQAELASHYGADEVIRLTSKNRYFPKAASSLHAKLLTPIFGSSIAQGGADITFECVGKESSIHDALRLTKSGGKVILLGLAGILNKIDWTTVWLNELTVKGSFAYSTEKYEGKKTRTYDIAIELMAKGKVDLSPLITHRFPLEQYKRAISTASNKGQEAVVKVVFEH